MTCVVLGCCASWVCAVCVWAVFGIFGVEIRGVQVKCPFCKADQDRVVDSRASEGGRVIRRRRECEACGRRFTTYERAEEVPPLAVVKKDRSRVPFDRAKIMAGLVKACYKRPVSTEALDKLVDEIEEELLTNFDDEVSSQFIGERVIKKLKELDKVAYVRYASVYREFKDVSDFIDEAQSLMDPKNASRK